MNGVPTPDRMISKFLSRSAMMAFFGLLSSASALGFDLLNVAAFGLGIETDALLIANTLPLLISSIMVAAYQPVIVSVMYQWDQQKATGFVIRLSLAGAGLALAFSVGAPILVNILAPGLNPQAFYGAEITTIALSGTIPLLIIGEVARAFLQGHERFNASVIALLYANLASLLAMVLGVPFFGFGAAILARWMRALVLLLLAGWWAIRFVQWETQNKHTVKSKGDFLADANAATAAYVSIQVVFLLSRFAASFLPSGSVSAFEYAWRLLSHVIQWFIISPISVALPRLARKEERSAVLKTLQQAIIGLTLALTAAILLGSLFLRWLRPSPDMYVLAEALAGISLCLLSVGLLRMAHTAYIASHQPDRIMLIVLVTLIGGVISLPLGAFGIIGLGISLLVSLSIGAGVGLWLLNQDQNA